TGHIGLNHHLHQIGATNSPNCPYCEVSEMVEHFLLTCQRYTSLRSTLHSTTKLHNLQLWRLLSSGSKNIRHVL
ncbi:hypothetical protein BT96DRAFT_839658, partial [Gymnopus androsaceus JB14]